MDLNPEEKGWGARHPVVLTFIVILLIAAAGATLKVLQEKYFPAEEKQYKTPVFVNDSFNDVDSLFNIYSNLTDEEANKLFDENYRYNVFKWTCRPLSCHSVLSKPTLKLICAERGFTEDVRIVMNEDCSEYQEMSEVTVAFQLISRAAGQYYLGRAGKVVEPSGNV